MNYQNSLSRKTILERGTVPSTKVLYATNGHFRDVVNYKNYRLLVRFQTYTGEMAPNTCKHVKRIETRIKAYKLKLNGPHHTTEDLSSVHTRV